MSTRTGIIGTYLAIAAWILANVRIVIGALTQNVFQYCGWLFGALFLFLIIATNMVDTFGLSLLADVGHWKEKRRDAERVISFQNVRNLMRKNPGTVSLGMGYVQFAKVEDGRVVTIWPEEYVLDSFSDFCDYEDFRRKAEYVPEE